MSISDRIRSLRKAKQLTQKQVADYVGIDRASVSFWEKGSNIPSHGNAEKLAEVLGVTESFIFYGEGKQGEKGPTCGGGVIYNIRPVPILTWSLARKWSRMTAEEREKAAEDVDFEPVAGVSCERPFALPVQGDAMAPEFCPGEVIVVDPDGIPETGDYVVVEIGDGLPSLKCLIYDGDRVFLKSVNSEYSTIDVSEKGFTVLGVVCNKVKKYK